MTCPPINDWDNFQHELIELNVVRPFGVPSFAEFVPTRAKVARSHCQKGYNVTMR